MLARGTYERSENAASFESIGTTQLQMHPPNIGAYQHKYLATPLAESRASDFNVNDLRFHLYPGWSLSLANCSPVPFKTAKVSGNLKTKAKTNYHKPNKQTKNQKEKMKQTNKQYTTISSGYNSQEYSRNAVLKV